MSKRVKAPKAYDHMPAKLLLYRWGGKWGPFKVKIPCGECTLTTDIVKDVLENELKTAEVELTVRDWLSYMVKAFFQGARHAPVLMLNGKVLSQGVAINRGLLAEAVMTEHVQHFPLKGTHVFGKENCGYCTKAKEAAMAAGIPFEYHDVVKNPGAMYEMLARVKPIVGPKTPITTPQIWIDGAYIGGYDQLQVYIERRDSQRAEQELGSDFALPPKDSDLSVDKVLH